MEPIPCKMVATTRNWPDILTLAVYGCHLNGAMNVSEFPWTNPDGFDVKWMIFNHGPDKAVTWAISVEDPRVEGVR